MKNKKYLLLLLPIIGLTACNGDASTIKAKKYAPLTEEQEQSVTNAANSVATATRMKVGLSVNDLSFAMNLKMTSQDQTVTTKTALSNFHANLDFQYETTDLRDISKLNAALEITNLGFSYTLDKATNTSEDMAIRAYISNDYVYADISDTNLRSCIYSIICLNYEMQGVPQAQVQAMATSMMAALPEKIKLDVPLSSLIGSSTPSTDVSATVPSVDLSALMPMFLSFNDELNFIGVSQEGENTTLNITLDKKTIMNIVNLASDGDSGEDAKVVFDCIKYLGLDLSATMNSKYLIEKVDFKFEYSMSQKLDYQDLSLKLFMDVSLNIDYTPSDLVLPLFTDYTPLGSSN